MKLIIFSLIVAIFLTSCSNSPYLACDKYSGEINYPELGKPSQTSLYYIQDNECYLCPTHTSLGCFETYQSHVPLKLKKQE